MPGDGYTRCEKRLAISYFTICLAIRLDQAASYRWRTAISLAHNPPESVATEAGSGAELAIDFSLADHSCVHIFDYDYGSAVCYGHDFPHASCLSFSSHQGISMERINECPRSCHPELHRRAEKLVRQVVLHGRCKSGFSCWRLRGPAG